MYILYHCCSYSTAIMVSFSPISTHALDGYTLNRVTQCSISATVNYKTAKASVIELSIEAYTVITVLRFHEPSSTTEMASQFQFF